MSTEQTVPDAVTGERERIRQVARDCEATYPYQVNLRGGDSYWVAVPFEDHPELVGERRAAEAVTALFSKRKDRNEPEYCNICENFPCLGNHPEGVRG